jgi:hypothetical protein
VGVGELVKWMGMDVVGNLGVNQIIEWVSHRLSQESHSSAFTLGIDSTILKGCDTWSD